MGSLRLAGDVKVRLPLAPRQLTGGRLPLVLSVGNDPVLLGYREMVLRLAQCSVQSVLPHEAQYLLPGSFDVVILGHTIAAEEQEALASRVRREAPGTKLVALVSDSGLRLRPGLFDEELHLKYGPSELLAALTRCLA